MSFLSSIFLWAGFSVAIPILIALWNRRRFQKEAFGGYFLLRQILETTRRRFRIFEILKLLNRLLLFTLLVTLFANPFRIERRLESASEGFAIFIDVGRIMQSPAETGEPLAALADRRLIETLKTMPEESQGALFFVSDRCDTIPLLSSHRLTARASEWISHWSIQNLPLSSQATTSQGLSQCLQRARSLFGEKKIFMSFISPMPSSLDSHVLETQGLHLDRLKASAILMDPSLEIQQEVLGDRLRVRFSPPATRKAAVIHDDRVEDLGQVTESLDVLTADNTYLWIQPLSAKDPWVGQKLISLHQATSMKVTLWAEKESPGYLSLLAALRNYAGLKVSRQIGGEPTGDSVIVYRSFRFDPTSLPRAWFFVDFDRPQPFVVRDQKQWVPGLDLSDARKAFQMITQDGRIFVKKYVLLDLDRYETFETFEDGAPSLLRDRESLDRHWISPFDLEDLTTDLSLEPTFIPYFYRRLERWLAVDQSAQSGEWQPLWTMPGVLKPTPEVLARQAWPGIYIDSKSRGQFKIVEPSKLPESFLDIHADTSELSWREEKVFLKEKILKALGISLGIELLLCIGALRWAWIGLWFLLSLTSFSSPLRAANVLRPISVGILSSMDADRKLALTQSFLDFERMSNLVFEKPEETIPSKFWTNAAIVISSTKPFGPFKREEREQIRDYCERGGVLIFDDPLASADSEFYRSVKKELAEIFPGRELSAVPKEDVLFRTFYLLTEVSGRKLASPYLEGIALDKRWVAIFSFNDILGANLRSARGDYALSVTPYGVSQRTLAKRLWLNLMMYAVTLDYKDDAIHLPHILKKRAR